MKKSAAPAAHPKRGLVVEGGGMRGAHSCGALMKLVERGEADFDTVCATSAGACTVAFLVSGQLDRLGVIWSDYLHDGRFISLKRLFTRRSVMDLDYLIDEVFGRLEPLDLEALRASPIDFFITATDCHTGRAHYFDNRHPQLFACLKAGAAMPIAYRHEIVIDGRHYLDGGIADSIPIQKAIDEGCTDLTVLLTREAGYRKEAGGWVSRLYRKKYPALAEALARRGREYNETLDRIERGAYPARLTVIRPSGKLPVSRLTTRRGKILATIRQGERDAEAALRGQRPI